MAFLFPVVIDGIYLTFENECDIIKIIRKNRQKRLTKNEDIW